MEMLVKSKVSERLKSLRVREKWSQSELAQKLNELIGYNSDGGVMNLEGETGKQTVSQLERATRSLTLDLAFAYAHIFDVSLDYVFGRSDDWQHKNRSVKEATGLSDAAIEALAGTKDKRKSTHRIHLETGEKKPSIDFISVFIENEQLWRNIAAGIDYIADYKLPDMSVPGNTFHSDMQYVEPGLYFRLQSEFTHFIEEIVTDLRKKEED